MSLASKLVLGAIGIAGAGTTAVILTKSLSEPASTTLSECKEENCKYTGKFGGVEANRKFLVADLESNKEWWDWIYKNRLEPVKNDSTVHSDFQKISSGYGSSTESSTYLNKLCASIYQKNKTDKPNLKNSAARFCAIGGTSELASPES